MTEKILKTTGVSFHGECTIVRADLLGINDIPKDAVEQVHDKQGRLLVAHSESGHHHYVAEPGVKLYHTSNPLIKFLNVELDAHAMLRHAKPESDGQKHCTQEFGPGLYRVSIQREMAPEGWRRVTD